VLFHKPSGKTHFVNAATAYLLCELLQKPQPLGAVVALFAPSPEDEDGESVGAVLDLLRHLEDLGLIERHE
jgi:PqqD family protein of HPr-rel-A system